MIREPLRALLSGIVDYAGLFPPAGLDMPTAVTNYAGYRASADAWALGRFVVPVARLDEFVAARDRTSPHTGAGAGGVWRLSALVGADAALDVARVREFNRAHADRAVVDVLEARCDDRVSIGAAAAAVPRDLALYIEVPVAGDVSPLLRAIRDLGARAKIRTGGITPDAFPPADDVVRFLRGCVTLDLPFKATAGLHHPIRATYRLTYGPDAPRGTMFGFLNVFLAAAALHAGAADDVARSILESTDPADFRFDDAGVTFRDRRFDTDTLRRARDGFAVSFGSCSFREPIDDLHALGLI